MKINGRIILFTVVIIAMATLSKLLFASNLDWSGFSPVIAIALFSGMIVKEKNRSFLFPLLALLISDVLIEVLHRAGYFPFAGLYKYQWLNYALLLLSALAGWMLKGKNYFRIAAGAVMAPTVFFLISNFTVWAGHGGYQRPPTFEGLLLCFGDGLPFYKNSLIATLLYVPALLFLYNYIVKRSHSLELA